MGVYISIYLLPDDRHRLTYEVALRDVLPRRHMTVPYAYDASIR